MPPAYAPAADGHRCAAQRIDLESMEQEERSNGDGKGMVSRTSSPSG
jgi:hypothetical protein